MVHIMRAFIVGNGPSLTPDQLEMIKGEVSFACNRIWLMYNRTQWRPTHYVRAEELILKDPKEYHNEIQMHVNAGVEVWANLWFTKGTTREGVNTIKSCAHYLSHFDHVDAPHLWHLPTLCTFGSSLNVAIQIAVQQGYKPLYLIGCDLGYKDGEPSHFDENYETGGERPARYSNLDTLLAHVVAARSSPVKIFNATDGGELEVYERVRLKDIL